ncbi:MAG: hypothetical protein KatS3mg113_0706 [Planctomycetaceae bacterium]|nr:MAG: hypothetical protein KatS3mg113_0706 [Planctomycetaceae bacterium]
MVPPGWIVFDAVGTLIAPREPIAETYCRFARSYGIAPSTETIGSMFTRYFAQSEALSFVGESPQPGWETNETAERVRWLWIIRQLFPELSWETSRALFDELWQYYASAHAWCWLPSAIEVISELRRRGWKLAIASNFDDRLEPLLAQLWPDHPCMVLVSSALGWRKPAPAFYDLVCLRCQSSPQQMVMVGDDYEHDYSVPRHMGWHACRVGHPSSSPPADILDLAELPAWLERHLTVSGRLSCS